MVVTRPLRENETSDRVSFDNETCPARAITRLEIGIFFVRSFSLLRKVFTRSTQNSPGHPSEPAQTSAFHRICVRCIAKAPSRQLLAIWAVEAWKKVPEDLVRRAWTVCQYKSKEDIANVDAGSSAIVEYDEAILGRIVEQTAGADALTLFNDPENEAEGEFPEDDRSKRCSSDASDTVGVEVGG